MGSHAMMKKGENSHWLRAFLHVTSPADWLWFLATVTKVPMHHSVVTFPTASILGVLDSCKQQEQH